MVRFGWELCGVAWPGPYFESIACYIVSLMVQSCAASLHPVVEVTSFSMHHALYCTIVLK